MSLGPKEARYAGAHAGTEEETDRETTALARRADALARQLSRRGLHTRRKVG